MRSLKNQVGLSSLGWLLVLLVGGFTLACFFKLGPHYLDHHYIDVSLGSLAEQGKKLDEMDEDIIIKQLNKFMVVNNVRGKEASAFKVVRRSDRTLVNNEYEVRVPMFINIDVVLTFRSQLDSSNPEICCEFLIENEK